MDKVKFTHEHLQIAGEVLSRAPTSLAERLILVQLFEILEGMLKEQNESEGDNKEDA